MRAAPGSPARGPECAGIVWSAEMAHGTKFHSQTFRDLARCVAMGESDTPTAPKKRRRRGIFIEVSEDTYRDVSVVARALGIPSKAAFVRRAIRRALYEARKEPMTAQ